MKLRAFILALIFVVSTSAAEFRNADVLGRCFSLVHNTAIEVYHFRNKDTVVVEIGEELNWLRIYECKWKIEKGRLVIAGDKFETQIFELIKMRESYLTLRRKTGEVEDFRAGPENN